MPARGVGVLIQIYEVDKILFHESAVVEPRRVGRVKGVPEMFHQVCGTFARGA